MKNDALYKHLQDIERIAHAIRQEMRKSDCNIVSVANSVEALTHLTHKARQHSKRRLDHALRRSGMVQT